MKNFIEFKNQIQNTLSEKSVKAIQNIKASISNAAKDNR